MSIPLLVIKTIFSKGYENQKQRNALIKGASYLVIVMLFKRMIADLEMYLAFDDEFGVIASQKGAWWVSLISTIYRPRQRLWDEMSS